MALTIAAKGPAGSVSVAQSFRRAAAMALIGALGLTGCVTTGAGAGPTAAGLAEGGAPTSTGVAPQLAVAKPSDKPSARSLEKPIAQPVAAKPTPAGAHPEARFIAEYGAARYLVNLRYVPFLRQSVVAVRPFKAAARLEGRRPIAVAPTSTAPAKGHFRDRAYKTVAIDIAEALTETPAACAEGRALSVAHDKHGAPKASYRRDHRVWIVFARCAAAPA